MSRASIPEQCPDTGTCHHACTIGCWRVTHAGPLSIAKFPGNRWPDHIKAEYADTDGSL
jgi:hypothetical protein